jgi:hypothetical protein
MISPINYRERRGVVEKNGILSTIRNYIGILKNLFI